MDGKPVFSKMQTHRFPENGEVVTPPKARLACFGEIFQSASTLLIPARFSRCSIRILRKSILAFSSAGVETFESLMLRV